MRRGHKILLGVLAAVTTIILKTSNILAAPIYDLPVELKQNNGQVIHCFVSGDEYTHYYHDGDKNIILKDSLGKYVYGINVDGIPVPSDVAVNSGLKKPDNAAKLSDIKVSENKIKEEQQSREYARKSFASSLSEETTSGVTKGLINNLVVFIKLQDDSDFLTPLSYYSGVFNSDSISMKNYFLEASYNKLTINSSFYPSTSGNTIVSYTDTHSRGYYEPYGLNNPDGYSSEQESELREQTLLRNAALSISSQVPSTLNLDNNSDGLIDSVSFVIKGGANGWGSLLWPHSWSLYSYYGDNIYINGKKVYNYDLFLEDFVKTKGIGVLCHEMFHTLGAPDLYHYTDIYSYLNPVGRWDIMESTTRQEMGAYMKYEYGKWIDNIPEITTGNYTLNPLTSPTNNAYKIKIPGNSSEYLMVEYRKQSGNYESQLPGSGLLVYRININSKGLGNSEGPPDEVYIFRPGGSKIENGYIDKANFSNYVGRSSSRGLINLVDSSNNKINITINNVVENSNSISFSVSSGQASLESSHPYNSYDDEYWNVDAPANVQNVSLTFNSLTEVESGNDYIYILDKNGNNINGSPFTGTSLAGKTITVNGNKVKIRLKTDKITTKYGFKVTNIKYGYSYTGSYQSNVQGNTLKLTGFGIYKSPIFRFDVYIDNALYGSAARFARNDLSKAYPYTDLSKAGFAYAIDTRYLKNGYHKVTVIARGTDGTTCNLGSKTVYINDKSLNYLSNLDKFQKTSSSNYSIAGWAAYGKYISKVEVILDKVVAGQANRYPRLDVTKAFPTYFTVNSGFSYNLNISKLSPGTHYVTIKFTSVDGSVYNINRVIKI